MKTKCNCARRKWDNTKNPMARELAESMRLVVVGCVCDALVIETFSRRLIDPRS